MIKLDIQGMDKLQRNLRAAPKVYRKAMLQALSTAHRDSKPEAVRVAQEEITAGRNAISAGLSTGKLDRANLSFEIIAKRAGISLVAFKHSASKRGGVRVQVNKRGGMSSALPATFKKRGSKSGKMRILQRVANGDKRVGRYPVIALASTSLASIITRKTAFERIKKFGLDKMSNELQRQIARAFPRG